MIVDVLMCASVLQLCSPKSELPQTHGKGMPLECCLKCHLVCLQAFHTLYHTDENVLLGAPTGSGKTISAELTMLHAFNVHPGQKIIYVAPLKVGHRHQHFSPVCGLEVPLCKQASYLHFKDSGVNVRGRWVGGACILQT